MITVYGLPRLSLRMSSVRIDQTGSYRSVRPHLCTAPVQEGRNHCISAGEGRRVAFCEVDVANSGSARHLAVRIRDWEGPAQLMSDSYRSVLPIVQRDTSGQ